MGDEYAILLDCLTAGTRQRASDAGHEEKGKTHKDSEGHPKGGCWQEANSIIQPERIKKKEVIMLKLHQGFLKEIEERKRGGRERSSIIQEESSGFC